MTDTDARTARLTWVKDDDPRWDADRERVFATVPAGVFRSEIRTPGERLSSDWWRVRDGDRVIGYGWLDDVWGDAEILLAVDAAERGSGVGSFVMAHLEREAAARGLNYVVNVVRDSHPERAAVTAWLQGRGFAAAEDGRLRKRVGTPGHAAAEPDSGRQARYAAERDRAAARPHPTADGGGEPMGPGHEESGGYVDVEEHRY
jgi:ribosomal protein S18 acetylase RimI-like enzyme